MLKMVLGKRIKTPMSAPAIPPPELPEDDADAVGVPEVVDGGGDGKGGGDGDGKGGGDGGGLGGGEGGGEGGGGNANISPETSTGVVRWVVVPSPSPPAPL